MPKLIIVSGSSVDKDILAENLVCQYRNQGKQAVWLSQDDTRCSFSLELVNLLNRPTLDYIIGVVTGAIESINLSTTVFYLIRTSETDHYSLGS